MSCSLLAALSFAADAHRGQLRADGTPFIGHPVAVLHILWRASLDLPLASSVAAVLHDVLEDTPVTKENLRMLAGNDAADAVDLLTRVRGQSEEVYLRRVASSADVHPWVPLIKMADRIHNLMTMAPLPQDRRAQLVTQTRDVYLPFFAFHRSLAEPYASAHTFLLAWMKRLVRRAEGMQENPSAERMATSFASPASFASLESLRTP